MKKLFNNEKRTIKKLDHPNIIRLVEYNKKARAIKSDGDEVKIMYMVLEYAENGEIFDYISETGSFSESTARFYFHQLISALEYIHKKGIYHRDIKPENILLDKDFNIKLADFGFATKSEVSEERKGTYGYMTPELLAKQEYNCAQADLFAAAVILFIWLCQHPPFAKAEKNDKYYKEVLDGKWKKFWKFYRNELLTEEFKDLFEKMASPDPTKRLTINQIKKHPWYNGPIASKSDVKREFKNRQTELTMIRIRSREKTRFDESETTAASSQKMSETQNKPKRKITQFFDIDDPEELLSAVIEVSNQRGYKVKKSDAFFNAMITVNDCDDYLSHSEPKSKNGEVIVTVSVLKHPKKNARALEFLLNIGDRAKFRSVFKTFKDCCKARFA